jgi:Flp pilus assembly protein TadD
LFEHTVEANPRSLAGLVNLGQAYADEAGRHVAEKKVEAARAAHAKAVSVFERAAQVWPKDFQVRAGLASLYKEQGRWVEAEKQYREAIGISPTSSEMHMGLGAMLGNQGKIDEAILEFEEAVRLDEGNGVAKRLLGQARALKEKREREAVPAGDNTSK